MAVNPTAFSDASSTNESDRSAQIYKDLSLSFSRHPITGDIAKVTDVDAVKRSVINLVQTNYGERPFHPEIGSDVRKALFEPVTPLVASLIERQIEDVIRNFEPRVEVANVICTGDIDANSYEVTIQFAILNSPAGVQTANLFLERLR